MVSDRPRGWRALAKLPPNFPVATLDKGFEKRIERQIAISFSFSSRYLFLFTLFRRETFIFELADSTSPARVSSLSGYLNRREGHQLQLN